MTFQERMLGNWNGRVILKPGAAMSVKLAAMFLIFLLSLAVSKPLSANENYSHRTVPIRDNIGFARNPPEELKKKFPMCDAFLKVDWIDKKKKIGYSHYDLYREGKPNGQMWALVYLEERFPHFDYDLNEYRRRGNIDSILRFIREGNIVGDVALLNIRRGDEKITFWPTIPANMTFADNYQNVCISYPDGERAWIAEGKQIGKIFTEQLINEKFELIKKFFPSLLISSFKKMGIIDFNNDGKEDYYRGDGWTLYSYQDKYFEIVQKTADFRYTRWYSPNSNKHCEVERGLHYLTTDGQNYFISNQCSLTDLTKKGE